MACGHQGTGPLWPKSACRCLLQGACQQAQGFMVCTAMARACFPLLSCSCIAAAPRPHGRDRNAPALFRTTCHYIMKAISISQAFAPALSVQGTPVPTHNRGRARTAQQPWQLLTAAARPAVTAAVASALSWQTAAGCRQMEMRVSGRSMGRP